MIPKWQRKVFTLHYRIFNTFMSPLPLAWLANETKFVYIHTYKRWIPFLFWSTIGSIVCVGCAYDVITCFKFGRSDMDIPTGLMLASAGIALALNSVLWVNLIVHPYTIPGLNQLFIFKAKLIHNLGIRENNRIRMFDLVLLTLVMLGLGTPTTIYIVSLALKFDPMYFVLKDLQTLAPGKPNFPTEVFIFVARLIFQACVFECGRTLTGMVVLLCSIVEGVATVLHTLLHFISQGQRVKFWGIIKPYVCLYLIYCQLKGALLECISRIISVGFWFLVIIIWILFRLPGKIPLPMYWLFEIFGGGFFITFWFLLYLISNVNANCVRLLSECEQKSKFYKVQTFIPINTKREREIMYLRVIALKKLIISYKPFQNINQEFAIDVLRNQMLRVFDALILLNY